MLEESVPQTTSAELYNPAIGTWAVTGSLVARRYGPTATLLNNGKVLVTGGSTSGGAVLASAELYDPLSGSWTLTGFMISAREYHTAILLQDGKVLVAAGFLLTRAPVGSPVANST